MKYKVTFTWDDEDEQGEDWLTDQIIHIGGYDLDMVEAIDDAKPHEGGGPKKRKKAND
jgi:hypothetical protein